MQNAISPKRSEDYPNWYLAVIKAADLAEHSVVRGCMTVMPWGYGIWENIQKILDERFKLLGVKNAYFPLFIPLSFFEKEAKHIEGFATECAVVTHHKLVKAKDGTLVPACALEEPLIVRPTSEMIVGTHFAKWITSHRDLPLLINQWANVVRWEMRTRLFLRTAEILWQEGHTAHATAKEADDFALQILDIYADFLENTLAIPVIRGRKSDLEKFPGAEQTYTFEAMMQDRRALQAGTSHFLGQNFAKSCDIQFQNKEENQEFVWTTSWGATTRLIGALIMVHSDDDGLVLPPKVAPSQVVILPVLHDDSKKEEVLAFANGLKKQIEQLEYDTRPIRVEIDLRDMRGGEKNWSWIKKGIPLRVEIGPRDLEKKQIVWYARTAKPKDKNFMQVQEFINSLPDILESIQSTLFTKACHFRDMHIVPIEDKEEFYRFFMDKNDAKKHIQGGFASVFFCEDRVIEEKIKQDLGVSLRCIPFSMQEEKGVCIFTGKKECQKVIFAKAY